MERVTTASGIALGWQELGAGEPTIVAVAQWFLSSRSAAASPFVHALARRHRVVLYDRRGTGASDKPGPPYTSARDAKDLAGLADAVGLEGFALVGLGVRGSQVALTYAGHFPERVRCLVCIGGTPKWSASPEWPYGIAAGTFHTAFAATPPDPAVAPGEPGDDATLAAAMRADWVDAGVAAANDMLHRTLDEDLRPFLRRVTPPTLVVHLRGDVLVSFEAARWLAESLPAGHLEVFESPRGVPLRAPEELAGHIEEFLTLVSK